MELVKLKIQYPSLPVLPGSDLGLLFPLLFLYLSLVSIWSQLNDLKK